MKIIKNRHYVNSFASTSDIEALEEKMTKIAGEVVSSSAASWAQDGNTDLIPSDKLPSYVDDVVEVDQLPEEGESGKIYIYENKQYRWSGTEFVPIESGGVVIGTITGTAYDGGKGTELEGRVSTVETNLANYPTKDEVDTSVNGITDKIDGLISEVGDSLQVGKADKDLNLNTTDNKVMINSYGTVVYSTPYPGDETRRVVQLKNNDQISGVTTTGAGVPLIFMSKWDKVEVGGGGAPLNLNSNDGTITINDDKVVATVDQIPVDYQKNIVSMSAEIKETASMEMGIDVSFSNVEGGQSMDLSFNNFRWPIYVRINPRTYEKKIYTAEEIYAFFGATDVVSMRSVVSRGGMFVLNFGLNSVGVGNMNYNIPIQYIEVGAGSDTPKITVKAWGPDSSNDKLSQYTITMNTDGTAIEDTGCNIGFELIPIQQ